MNMMEKSELVREICAACGEIGSRLGHNGIIDLAKNAAEHLEHTKKLRIAFIGTQIHSLQTALNDALPSQLLKDPLPQLDQSIDLLLSYGEQQLVPEAVEDGAANDSPVIWNWQLKEDILQQMDVEIICDHQDYKDFDWKEKLAQMDYLFFVMDATHLLAAVERDFITGSIQKYFGTSRYAMVVTNTEIINTQEDYDALFARVDWFLQSLDKGGKCFETGMGTLQTFLCDELLSAEQDLRELAVSQTAKVCLIETREKIEELAAGAETDIQKLDDSIVRLEKRQDKMKRMGEAAAAKANSEINGSIQYSCHKSIIQYIDQLEENISRTIQDTEDITHAAEMLPRFLSAAEDNCFNQLRAFVETEMADLNERMQQDMAHDAGEFFEGIPDDIIAVIDYVQPKQSPSDLRFHVDEESSETQKKIKRYSRAMLIGAVPAALMGFFPLAAGGVIGSQLVKKLSKEKIEKENREALLQQIHILCQTLKSEIQKTLTKVLEDICEKAEQGIKDAYDRFVTLVMAELSAKREQAERAASQRQLIFDILRNELPKLEENLHGQ